MTLGAVIALALLKLEDELLLALELLDHLAGDLLLGQGRGVDKDLLAVVKYEDVELNLVAKLRVELLEVDYVALGNLVLLAASRDDCVHLRALHCCGECNSWKYYASAPVTSTEFTG